MVTEKQNVVSLHTPIPRKDMKILKALCQKDKDFHFTSYMYDNRERLVGQADLQELDYFLENVNVNLNEISTRGVTLLPLAVDFYAPAVLKYLLDKGLNHNELLPDGKTLLQFAETKLQEALKTGWSSNSPIVKCAEQSVELLKQYENKN